MFIGEDRVTDNNKSSQLLRLVSIFLLLLFIGLCVGITVSLFRTDQLEIETKKATREASQQLLIRHGQEVIDVIEDFEVIWHSFEARKKPEILSDIATGHYLEQRLRTVQDAFPSRDEWLVVESATMTRLQIYEFDTDRFKAGACLEEELNNVNSEGIFIRSVSKGESCGIFVFVRESSNWKMAGFFYTNLPYSAIQRDWSQLPDWLKKIMGELPDDVPMPRQHPLQFSSQ